MARITSAAVRAEVASERRERALQRDRLAQQRDAAADDRDRFAAEDEPVPEMGQREEDAAAPAAVARTAAATARADAAEDRELSRHDREQAARDREEARQDRELLTLEIERSHLDEATGAYRRQIGEVFLRHEIDRAWRRKGQLVVGFLGARAAVQTERYDRDFSQDALFRDLFLFLRMRLRPFDPIVRWDQGEFVCAIAEVGPEEARGWIEEARCDTAGRHPNASTAAGVALDLGGTLDSLVEAARRSARGFPVRA